MSLAFYILDLETTGFNCNYHEMVELSIIRASDKMQLTKNIACQFPKRANIDTLKLLNKSVYDLYRGEKKEDVINTVNTFIESDGLKPDARVIVAYNGAFDRRFIHANWAQQNKMFPANFWIDPYPMMKKYAKDQNLGKISLKLGNACDMFNIKQFQAHTAKGDTRRLFLLFEHLTKELNMDYLPFIKEEKHFIKSKEPVEYSDEDLSLADGFDF